MDGDLGNQFNVSVAYEDGLPLGQGAGGLTDVSLNFHNGNLQNRSCQPISADAHAALKTWLQDIYSTWKTIKHACAKGKIIMGDGFLDAQKQLRTN